jgi:hypothetical protein
MPDIKFKTATIASSGTTSSIISMDSEAGYPSGGTVMGVILPAAFTGTALGLEVSDTLNGTYVTVYDPNKSGGAGAYSVACAQGNYIPFKVEYTSGMRYLKIVSGSSEGAARTLKVAVRSVQ